MSKYDKLKDTRQKKRERQRKRRRQLNDLAKSLGVSSWSKLETEAIQGRIGLKIVNVKC